MADHRRFTDGVATLEVEGATVGAVIDELERRYPAPADRVDRLGHDAHHLVHLPVGDGEGRPQQQGVGQVPVAGRVHPGATRHGLSDHRPCQSGPRPTAQFDADHQAEASHLGHGGVGGQTGEAPQQVRPLGGAGCHQVLVLEDPERGEARRTGSRVRRVGEEHEALPGGGDRRHHRLGGVHAAQRCVTAGQALAADQHVGHHVPVVDAEALPGPSEPGHDLVGDQQHAVLVAEGADVGPPAVRGHERSGRGPDHRLGDHRRHRLRPLVPQHLLEVLGVGHRHLGMVGQRMLEE